MKTGLDRDTQDAFFTKKEVAKYLVDKTRSLYRFSDFDVIIEPSAGSGVFSDLLRTYHKNVKAYDIEPRNRYVKRADFLKQDLSRLRGKIMVIGNPPFGRQSSMAKQFIAKSAEIADVIAFVLPKSFKKESMKNAFPPTFHLVSQSNLPRNSFEVDGMEYDVPCVFQIWEKRDRPRRIAKVEEPVGFRFVDKKTNPDFAIRRIGVNAGKIKTGAALIADCSENSHYFIKLTGSHKRDFIAKYVKITFTFDNTVGPRSISKGELVRKVNYLFL